MEQATHVRAVVSHTKGTLDDDRNPFAGPDVASEAMRRSALVQQDGQGLQLGGRQLTSLAVSRLRSQAGFSKAGRNSQPLAHSGFAYAKRFGDQCVRPAKTMEGDGPKSSRLSPCARWHSAKGHPFQRSATSSDKPQYQQVVTDACNTQ
jgi:hypothetical protein